MEVEEGLYMEEELFVLGQEDLYMEVLPFSDQTDVVEILLLHLTLGCYAPNNLSLIHIYYFCCLLCVC